MISCPHWTNPWEKVHQWATVNLPICRKGFSVENVNNIQKMQMFLTSTSVKKPPFVDYV